MVPYPSHSQMRNVNANRTLCSVERRFHATMPVTSSAIKSKPKLLQKNRFLIGQAKKYHPSIPLAGSQKFTVPTVLELIDCAAWEKETLNRARGSPRRT